MIALLWLDLARICIPGIVLGFVVARLVLLRPFYLRWLHPRFWLRKARKMQTSE